LVRRLGSKFRRRLTIQAAGSRKLAHRWRPGDGLPPRTFPKKDGLAGLLLKKRVGNTIWRAEHYLSSMLQNLFKFFQEVRAEGQKVTWPTRKETTVTTMMVFVMVFIASIFFLIADQIMHFGVGLLLGINS
jgi:preprotein translocase subunit SecE